MNSRRQSDITQQIMRICLNPWRLLMMTQHHQHRILNLHQFTQSASLHPTISSACNSVALRLSASTRSVSQDFKRLRAVNVAWSCQRSRERQPGCLKIHLNTAIFLHRLHCTAVSAVSGPVSALEVWTRIIDQRWLAILRHGHGSMEKLGGLWMA